MDDNPIGVVGVNALKEFVGIDQLVYINEEEITNGDMIGVVDDPFELGTLGGVLESTDMDVSS